MRTQILGVFLAASSFGCHAGLKAENLAVAQSPGGALGTIDLQGGGTVQGELLAVDDSALTMLRDRNMVVVRYSRIRQARFPQLRYVYAARGEAPDPATQRSLRLISHFPQGISSDLRPRLAAIYGVDSVAR
jgi:hypothetical protein